MELNHIVSGRYSVRKFSNQAVEGEKVNSILQSARLAPTAANRQPQRILVAKSAEDLSKIDECTACRFGAPVVFLICFDSSACWVRGHDSQISGWVDASIVTTHMMLTAFDMRLGTTWVMHFDSKKASQLFELPENIIPVAMLPTGYPAPDAAPHARHFERMDISDILI